MPIFFVLFFFLPCWFFSPIDHIEERKKRVLKAAMHDRIRYRASIVEAFAESQAVCRIQLSFYFAFSLIVSLPKWTTADCIIKNVLPDDFGLFTAEVKDWHGMSIIAFSSTMSVISISMAQYSMYRTRHNYELAFFGKLVYLFRLVF